MAALHPKTGAAPTPDPRAARFMATASLPRAVTAVRHVTDAKASSLARLGVRTVGDELLCAPHRYVDFSQVTPVAVAPVGGDATAVVTVESVNVKHPRPRMTIVEVYCYDESAPLVVSFFGQPWLAGKFSAGMRVAFSGKMTFSYGYKRMSSPFFDIVSDPADESPAGAPQRDRLLVLPIHRTTEGLSAAWARRIAASAIEDFGQVCDVWPARMRARLALMPLARALRCIHFPTSVQEAEQARRRLAFDEAAIMQIALAARRDIALPGVHPVAHATDGPARARLGLAMPFELTADQQAAVREVLADMGSPRPMNRLLLGDVGTGKTAVAVHAIVACADTGTQCAVMAPTGVLAAQYAAKVGPVLDKCGVSWALLTGATPASERADIVGGAADGSTCVLFGTHALLTDDVVFARLSLVVIDEQQRFGVEQRHALREKGRGADLLVMTATPIPRTLALSIYGDLERSYLRQRPVKGAGVTTRIIRKSERALAYDAMRAEIAKGRQAYVVCPLVGCAPPAADEPDSAADRLAAGDDSSDPRAAQTEVETLRRTVFPDAAVGLLTGRMKPSEKTAVMDSFKAGEIDVLVSTTVVEVGVDVPNATVMLVEDGERFGLAQLHQLRGRVGRGSHPGTVFVAADLTSDASKRRLEALARTDDGFELAEADLRLRREGDIMGERQSGGTQFRFVDLGSDLSLLESARDEARALLGGDPLLEHDLVAPVRAAVIERYGDVFKEVGGG